MPYKKSYKRKRSTRRYGKRRKYKSKRTMMRRRRYKKPDTGTYLKVSSNAVPVVINNKTTPVSPYAITQDTYQHALLFQVGEPQDDQEDIIITNEADPNPLTPTFPITFINLGTDAAYDAYTSLYKYVQIYKIVVKFYPTITEGGTLTSTTQVANQFSNAISGQVTTDVAREAAATNFTYYQEYPADLAGQAKSMSRKISRNHNILKPWTRTFVPSRPINPQTNPQSEYQYKPKYLTTETQNLTLGDNQFIMRMKKPSVAGFAAPNLEGTENDFPPLDQFVRYGTLQATAYIKFSTPYN